MRQVVSAFGWWHFDYPAAAAAAELATARKES
jgi:hypothetical protein